MNSNSIILAVIFLIALNESSYAAMPPYFKEGQLQIRERSDYYWTNSNYDEFGDTQKLPGTTGYNNLSNTLDGTYFYSGDLAINGGMNLASAKSLGIIEDRNNTELSEAHARVSYKYPTSFFTLIPEVELRLSLNTVDPLSDSVLTSEGANAYKAGAWLYSSLGILKMKVYGYLGYQHRDDGRSALLPWTAGFGWRTQKWLTSFELGGYKSISDDQYVNARFKRQNVSNAVNAGSLRFYSVNPSLVEARAELGYGFTRNFTLNGGLTYSLMGENTAQGQSVFIGFNYNFSAPPPAASGKKNSGPSADRLKKFEFQLEDDYDESIFEDED